MLAALIQLKGRSSRFETGAVAGLLERRKLCLPSANLRQAPQPDRAVLEMMLDAVKQVRSGYEPPVGCEARQRSRMRADERVRCERVVLEGVPVRQWDVVPGIAARHAEQRTRGQRWPVAASECSEDRVEPCQIGIG
jgi:hypothetical protein